MRRRALLLLALLAAPPGAGCLSLVDNDKEARYVAGPTRGYSPTPSFLKVHVEGPDGKTVNVNFDRREWHVSELARRLDNRSIQFLHVEAIPREILNEVLVEQVLDPDQVSKLRYSAMAVSEEEKALLDAEYDDLLRMFERGVPTPELPGGSNGALPEPTPVDLPA